MLRYSIISVLVVLVGWMLLPSSRGSETQPAEKITEPLQASIISVEGLVEVRGAEDQPWQPAVVGMVVGQGAEFRTGPRSAVRFTIPPGHTITLDRLGTVALLEAVKAAGKVRTCVGMTYGRVEYQVEAAGLEHEATIRSPGSTLAVRGTRVSLTNQLPFKPTAVSLTGRARFTDTTGRVHTFGSTALAVIESQSDGSAATSLGRACVDPASPLSRSPAEQQAIAASPAVGAFSAGSTTPLQVLTAPTALRRPADLLDGSLAFYLVWIGSTPGSITPDLDLVVTSPRGESLDPKISPASVGSGGRRLPDDQGGKADVIGQEMVWWPDSFPAGRYVYRVRHAGGPEGEYQLAVIRDGQLVGDLAGGSLDSDNALESYSLQILTAESPQAARSVSVQPRKAVRPASPRDPARPQMLRQGRDKVASMSRR